MWTKGVTVNWNSLFSRLTNKKVSNQIHFYQAFSIVDAGLHLVVSFIFPKSVTKDTNLQHFDVADFVSP